MLKFIITVSKRYIDSIPTTGRFRQGSVFKKSNNTGVQSSFSIAIRVPKGIAAD